MFCIHLFIHIRIFSCVCVCVYFRPLQMLQHWRSHVSTFNFWGQVVDFWESLRSMIGRSELPEVMKKGFWYRKNWGNWEEWVNLTTIAMAIVLEEPRCKSAVFQSLLVKLLAPFGWKVCCHDALSGGSVVRPVAMFWSYLRCRFAS